MDYRMWNGGAKAGENVIPIIIKSLNNNGEKQKPPLKMVAFEGDAGTSFKLNNHPEATVIPSTGQFYTPYGGDRFMPIFSLVFDADFSGNIYYII